MLGQAGLGSDCLELVAVDLVVQASGNLYRMPKVHEGFRALHVLGNLELLDHGVLNNPASFGGQALGFLAGQPNRDHLAPPIFAMIWPRSAGSQASSLPLRSFASHRPSLSHMSARWLIPSASFSTRRASTSSKK